MINAVLKEKWWGILMIIFYYEYVAFDTFADIICHTLGV